MPINMKALIAETFASLAQHKDIDKITVKDLVEACSISRQTFYLLAIHAKKIKIANTVDFNKIARMA